MSGGLEEVNDHDGVNGAAAPARQDPRRLREGTGLTIEQVAQKLELSPSTISRIETAQVGVRPRSVRDLMDVYDVAQVRRAELLELARKSRQQPWWYEYREVPSASVVGYEFDAASILQTPLSSFQASSRPGKQPPTTHPSLDPAQHPSGQVRAA